MSNRRRMGLGDWANGAALLAVGVFLGLALYHMTSLVGTTFWPLIILIPVLFGSVFLADLVLRRVFDRIFRSGIKPAPQATERTPLALLLSLPTGIVIGVVGALLGLGEILL